MGLTFGAFAVTVGTVTTSRVQGDSADGRHLYMRRDGIVALARRCGGSASFAPNGGPEVWTFDRPLTARDLKAVSAHIRTRPSGIVAQYARHQANARHVAECTKGLNDAEV